MTRPTLTPAQTRALMWLDGEWKHTPGSGHTNSCRALSSVGLGLADPRRTYTSFESYRLTPAGLALKATLQREQSADAGPSDTRAVIDIATFPRINEIRWCMHVIGPDEIHAADSYFDAVRMCAEINRDIAEFMEGKWDDRNYPITIAIPVPDPRGAMQSDPYASAAAVGDNETSRGLTGGGMENG